MKRVNQEEIFSRKMKLGYVFLLGLSFYYLEAAQKRVLSPAQRGLADFVETRIEELVEFDESLDDVLLRDSIEFFVADNISGKRFYYYLRVSSEGAKYYREERLFGYGSDGKVVIMGSSALISSSLKGGMIHDRKILRKFSEQGILNKAEIMANLFWFRQKNETFCFTDTQMSSEIKNCLDSLFVMNFFQDFKKLVFVEKQ